MPIVFFFLVLLSGAARGEWDLAVLTSTSLELLAHNNTESSLMYSAHLGVKNLTALTYDPLLLHHYFAATGHQNASIFRVQVSQDGRVGPVEPLVKKQPEKVSGLAFDAESTSVFWTTQKNIFRSQLDVGLTDAEVVHSFDSDTPLAIVVEPCKRYIYWSYSHSYIDRSLMDGTNKERIVDDLFMPVAITISQAERRIYWADEGPGYSYRIGRALLDGSNKEIVLEALYQQPSSLVVRHVPSYDSVVYWTDKMSRELWSFSKQNNNTKPQLVHSFDQPIYGVAAADSFEQLDKHVCAELIAKRDQVPYAIIKPSGGGCVHGSYSTTSGSCICTPGYIGTLCETSICYNYCLSGSCSMTSGKPYCRCPKGKSGLRCEVDRCRGYCFHGGCSIEENDLLSCTCHPGWYGSRCNYSEQFCAYACSNGIEEQHSCNCNLSVAAALTPSINYSDEYKIGFIVTSGVCALMSLCIVGLAIRNWRLGKRPRVKRHYTVTPNKGSAGQPVRTSPDCQIAIENCCNMNICETPCYEPELRPSGGKSKKEEKRGLLREMEVQPDVDKTF